MVELALCCASGITGTQSARSRLKPDFDVAHIEKSKTEPGKAVAARAARDCLPTHLNILATATFAPAAGIFSGFAKLIIQYGRPFLMKESLKRVFQPQQTAASMQRIT